MKAAITCILMLVSLSLGFYGHSRALSYYVPLSRSFPGVDDDPLTVGILQAALVLPAVGLVSLLVAVLHKWLMVPLALSLPALIYVIVHEGLFFSAPIAEAILPERVLSALNPFMLVLFLGAWLATLWVAIFVALRPLAKGIPAQ